MLDGPTFASLDRSLDRLARLVASGNAEKVAATNEFLRFALDGRACGHRRDEHDDRGSGD